MRHYDLWMERYNQRKTQIIDVLRKHHSDLHDIKKRIPSEEIIHPLPDEVDANPASMCFVDGGEGYRELLGAGLYFVRATSLLMAEKVGEQFVRDVDLGIIAYDENTKDRVELLREAMELDVALRTVRDYRPEYVFLDGSLYVKATRKPIACAEYAAYIKKYHELVHTASKLGLSLVGVSEDSKSRLLKGYLASRYGVTFPEFFTDPTILDVLAPKRNYATIKLRLTSNGIAYTTAYLKVHRLANPLRVDVAGGEEAFDAAAHVIRNLSRGSQHYGYPLPLYLAHLDARIDPKHADWSARRLRHHTIREDPELGEAIFGRTRRDLRPK